MNRLVRIALTLFVSATILIFLVLHRLNQAKQFQAAGSKAREIAESELKMVYTGMGLVGVMLTVGIGLMIVAFVRSRKKSASHG